MPDAPVVASDSPVTVAVTRAVKPGCEAAFEEALHRFARDSLRLPGQRGLHIIRPQDGPGPRTYGILRTFENAASYDEFLRTPEFFRWMAEIAPWIDGEPGVRRVEGIEAWLDLPGATARAEPPKWRLALVTYLAVNLVTTPLLWIAMPALAARVAFPWNNFLFNLPVVALLTWVLMPALGRVFNKYLHSK